MERQSFAHTDDPDNSMFVNKIQNRRHMRSESDHPAWITYQGNLLPEFQVRNFSLGGLYLECQDRNLEQIISNEDLTRGRRNQAFIEIQRLDKSGQPPFSLMVRLVRVATSGLGVAFLTQQDALLDYLKTREQAKQLQNASSVTPSGLSTHPGSGDFTRIIQEIQNISRRYISGKLSSFFSEIAQELVGARDFTNTQEVDSELFHGLETISTNREFISDSFIHAINSDLTLQGLAARNEKLFYSQSESQDLELVDKEDFEEWVIIIDIAHIDEERYAYNLQRLEKAFQNLAKCPVNNETNPLSPYSFLWLLNDTLDKLELEIGVKRTVFRILKDSLLVSINELYEELLDYLKKQGFSEEKKKVRPSKQTSRNYKEERQPDNGMSGRIGEQGQLPEREFKGYEEPVRGVNSIAAHYREPFDSSKPDTQRTSFETLSTLMYEGGENLPTSETCTVVSEKEVLQALRNLPQNPGPPILSRIGEQLSRMGYSSESSAIHPRVRNTIGAAEQMLEEIQNDQIMNDDLRTLIRGLKIPLLRESMLDPELLNNTEHPVHQLLDSIDRLAPYFTQDPQGSSESNAATERLRNIVADAAANARNIDIRGLTVKINSLLDQQQQRFRSNLAVVKDSTEDHERLKAIRLKMEALLTGKLKDKSVSVVLTDLLRLGWPEVLVQSAYLEGESSETWKTCEDVIGFLTLAFDSEQNLGTIPRDRVTDLCRVIKKNFSLYPLYPKETDELVKKIRTALFEKGEIYQDLLSNRITVDATFLKTLFHDEIPSDEDLGYIELKDSSWLDRIKGIEVDGWIAEHRAQGQVRLLNLAWKNPESTRYVFVDGSGKRVLDSCLVTLASQFEANKYSLLENRNLPLVERAVQKALKNTFEKIRRESDSDELTGLMNRKSFEREVARVMGISAHKKTQHILIMLDIDQFSMINDVCGLEGGDRLLRDITHILSTYVNPGTVQARTGDDEFTILLENGNLDGGFQLAEALRRGVDNFKFSWKSKPVPVTISVGLVRIDSNTTNPGDLLNDAFSACRAAKEAGKNCSRLHQPSSLEYSQRQRMIRSVPVIEKAVEENLIELFAQPITPLLRGDDGEHHEILLRVQNEDGDLESPVEFIQAAEQFDLMRSIDRWVVNAFFRWLEKHKDKVKTLGGFTVNLSGQSLLDNRFAKFLKEQIASSPLSPEHIGFEVTETALVKSTGQANSFIQGIREMGCDFYLDDFGSGYASYSHLKDMPVDVIKIDGVFVSDMLEQKSSYTMVKSVTEIAHFMDKKVIAEFVETEVILNALRKLKVDFAQGYAVGRPLPLNQILRNSATLN